MKSALSKVKILDLTRLLPGGFCTMLLADMGADVIKLEEPGIGDYIRNWPPLVGKNSGFHLVLNRNKRSVTLNLKTDAGRDIFKRLLKDVDVVVEGFRPGVMDRLGLGYEMLKLVQPRIIYCAITGYGLDGPRALKAGHDINYLALAGVLSYSGREGAPALSGVQIADIAGGALMAALSIVSALLAREHYGYGQLIDISMQDGSIAFNCLRLGKYLADCKIPSPGDDQLNHGLACYNIYETKDGRYMALGALEAKFWESFCEAMEQPDWKKAKYFEPGDHQRELYSMVSSRFEEKTQSEWIKLFAAHDCCCEPLLNLDEVMEDEHVKSRKMFVEMVHQQWGGYRQLGIAPKLTETPGSLRTHAPELGEHTEEALRVLGYSESEIWDLREANVI